VNEQIGLKNELANIYLRAIEKAFAHALENGGQIPTFGRARNDVHELLHRVGYPGSRWINGDPAMVEDGSLVEVNGIPIVRDDSAFPGSVELGFGTDRFKTDLMCVIGLRHAIYRRNAEGGWRGDPVIILDGIDQESNDLRGFVYVALHLRGAVSLDTWGRLSTQERQAIKTVLDDLIRAHNPG